MAKNIQAHIRYTAIDNCLRRRDRKWTWKDLSKACGEQLRERNSTAGNPSRRTIFYDMDNMRSGDLGYHAPIICVDRKYYIYEDPNFSIQKIPLSEKDFSDLNEVLNLMKSYQRMPLTKEFTDIVDRLALVIDNRMNPDTQRQLISVDQITDAPGQQYLHFLYKTIRDRKPVLLRYQSFKNTETLRIVVSPHLLKEYNKRWFVIGYHHGKKTMYTFALDRIIDVEEHLHSFFHEEPSFHPIRWYENIIGVTKFEDKAPEIIRIKVNPLRAKYLQTKPLHHSQNEVYTSDKEVHFTYRLIPNYELEAQLLAMADEVEVLRPLSLRDKIAGKLKLALKQYSAV